MDKTRVCARCGRSSAEGDHTACRTDVRTLAVVLAIAFLVVAAAASLARAG
jgi:hypothetical protein